MSNKHLGTSWAKGKDRAGQRRGSGLCGRPGEGRERGVTPFPRVGDVFLLFSDYCLIIFSSLVLFLVICLPGDLCHFILFMKVHDVL